MTERPPTIRAEPLSAARAEALRAKLDALTPEEIFVHGREAAVLVPLYEHEGRVFVVLTRRTETLPTHAGQISFPGGTREHEDEDLLATALREATEEIGLPAGAVAPLGWLATIPTYATEFVVTAYVGSIAHPGEWIPCIEEIDEIIELPIVELARSRGTEWRERDGIRWRMPVFEVDGHRVWGFTAFVLARLLDVAGSIMIEQSPDA